MGSLGFSACARCTIGEVGPRKRESMLHTMLPGSIRQSTITTLIEASIRQLDMFAKGEHEDRNFNGGF